MGFLDKAMAAGKDLAAKADTALAGAGLGGGSHAGQDSESCLRDLGVIAYLGATGRPLPPAEHDRVLAALQQLERTGVLTNLALRTSVGDLLPGQPGGMGYVPPPPGASPAPPAPGTTAPPAPPAPGIAPASVEGPVAPLAPQPDDPPGVPDHFPAPPPPSWA